MTDILIRLSTAVHGGVWEEYLSALGYLLPFTVAARHFNYSYSLPLYIKEMQSLPSIALEVHQQFLDGNFVVRTKDGNGNGVSPDLALEQTYNKDVKERSGLTGITLDDAARNKWIYTKPLVAACSSKYKDMVGLTNSSVIHHKHEGKESKVKEAVRVIKHDLINPFQLNSPDLINIATGQKASIEAQKDLTTLEKIGLDVSIDRWITINQR